ncbi:MAG: hypothetical protein DI538_24710, partial [Azospira oryzae]
SGTDLSESVFMECEFRGCNLSMVKLSKTALRVVRFKECKLVGLHFDDCHDFLFEVAFDHCNLHLSIFFRKKMKKTRFVNCDLREVDFSETDLGMAVFTNCDLAQATFDNTILEKADLSTSYNYSINPDGNYIKKARFSKEGVIGLLDRYDIVIE